MKHELHYAKKPLTARVSAEARIFSIWCSQVKLRSLLCRHFSLWKDLKQRARSQELVYTSPWGSLNTDGRELNETEPLRDKAIGATISAHIRLLAAFCWGAWDHVKLFLLLTSSKFQIKTFAGKHASIAYNLWQSFVSCTIVYYKVGEWVAWYFSEASEYSGPMCIDFVC